MENPIYVGLSRQVALWREMNVLANNVANVSTTSFKEELMVYRSAPTRTRFGDQVAFTIDHGTATSFQPGGMQATGNPLDLAIEGPGYFAVQGATRELYTRNGSFKLDADGQLVTDDGRPVLDTGQNPILIPPGETDISITPTGVVFAGAAQLGRLRVVEFDNPQGLERIGNSYFGTSQEPKQTAGASQVKQGALEHSNVQAVVAITDLVRIQRTYEGVRNLVETEHEREKDMISKLGRVA